jgi:hypothetical protein
MMVAFLTNRGLDNVERYPQGSCIHASSATILQAISYFRSFESLSVLEAGAFPEACQELGGSNTRSCILSLDTALRPRCLN